MYCEKISFKNFKDFEKNVKDFFVDELWVNTELFDSMMNERVHDQVVDMLNFFKTDRSPTEVEQYLIMLRDKSKKAIDMSRSLEKLDERWLMAREAYAYYGLGEVITEGSIYSEAIADELKSVFGENYLEELAKLDKLNPSKLTKFTQKLDNIENINSQIVKKYLLLKDWQDNQNIYHNSYLYPIFCACRDEFKEFYTDKYGELDCGSRELLVLYNLRKSPVIDIDTLACLVEVGMESELASVVGGKNYGLAVLRSYNKNIPKTLVLPISNSSVELVLSKLDKNKTYAIRSSATSEDGEKNSFAGMFDSCLDVKFENVLEKIEIVKNSCINPRVLSYIKQFNLNKPEMAIVVQEFIKADYSGVWLGQSSDTGILEWIEGCGDKLVSGKVTPTTEKVDLRTKTGIKASNELVGKILLDYQKEMGKICDFEWCIRNGEFYMLQFRPVTEIVEEMQDDAEYNISGTPASKGIAEGKVCYLEDVEDIESFEKGAILATFYTDPDWVEAMVNAKAIVTSEGGFLCHTAIIARELGIPCITGIGDDNLELLSNAENIIVNGSTGGIEILSKKKEIIEDNENEPDMEY